MVHVNSGQCLGCPPKLVSYWNNQNWNRNYFRHYPKQDVCFGCFALISKQGVSVFWNNRNKQKTNRNSSKFVKISTFLIPHTISSVCFGCFDTGPKHQNKTKKICLVSRKSKPENNRNRLSFGLFRFKPTKKINGFEDPLIENFFGDFFGLFRQNSVCFGCFDTGLKHRNKPKKMRFDFAKQTEKHPKQIEFRFVSVRTEKKNLIVSTTPYQYP